MIWRFDWFLWKKNYFFQTFPTIICLKRVPIKNSIRRYSFEPFRKRIFKSSTNDVCQDWLLVLYNLFSIKHYTHDRSQYSTIFLLLFFNIIFKISCRFSDIEKKNILKIQYLNKKNKIIANWFLFYFKLLIFFLKFWNLFFFNFLFLNLIFFLIFLIISQFFS